MNDAFLSLDKPAAHEGYVPVASAELYYRETGRGQPLIILHGGPDLDHNYLLPDMDRLSDSFRLIYYDQRGRGRSARHVQPEDVSIESEVGDLERVREYFGLESVAVLGHSWGGVLAMEYAIRHPDRLSHLVLMNTPCASHEDYLLFRQENRKRMGAEMEKLKALASSAGYIEGDPQTVADYYRIHFSPVLKQPEQLDRVIESLRLNFSRAGILKAWAIKDRLMNETLTSSEYTLFPGLRRLGMPALIIHGDDDFIPIKCAANIAQAIPGAHFVLLRECGHFSYLECPDEVHQEITAFFHAV